jgi:hypothetical protein
VASVEQDKPGAAKPPGVYARRLSPEKQQELDAAREMDGLSEEIAVLRMRLAELLDENAEEKIDPRVFMEGASVLIRAVATQYRLSPKATKDLAANIAAAMNSIGDQLFSPDR